ncbi:MAG: hypothetical protein ABF240_11700, partial [Flavobacteriales bacterium]
SVREKYVSQSKSTEMRLLIKGLEIIADSDTNYKTSKNHRLLVELTLIKLCSLSQGEQKKNLVTKDKPIPLVTISQLRAQGKTVDTIPSSQTIPKKEVVKEKTGTSIPVKEPLVEKYTSSKVESEITVTSVAGEAVNAEPTREKKKKVKFTGFSMKQSIQEKADEQEEEERNEKDPFTFEDLMVHWNKYAKDADEKNRKTLCTALTKTTPELQDNFMIIHTLENKPLFDNFNKEKQDFLDHLKKKLNNFSISIQSKLEKNETNEVFLYTDTEKFKNFAEQHPELLYLKEKLHLDFEF